MIAIGTQGIVELLQQILLFPGELDWCLDLDPAIQISGRMAAHRSDTFAADPEHPSGLGLGRNLQADFSVQRGHGDVTTQYGSCEAYGYKAGQIRAVALEYFVRPDANVDVEIAGWPATGAGPTLSRPGKSRIDQYFIRPRLKRFKCVLQRVHTHPRAVGT